MLNWLDVRMKEEQLLDIFRDANRRRVVKQALAARQAPTRFHTPALVQLGCWLVAWGCRLQARYGVIAEGATIARAGDRVSGC
jgi:hypothetical protein